MNYENVQEDGQYDSEFDKHKTIETIETKIASDGVEETHITHDIKKANRWTWAGWGDNYDKINWKESKKKKKKINHTWNNSEAFFLDTLID